MLLSVNAKLPLSSILRRTVGFCLAAVGILLLLASADAQILPPSTHDETEGTFLEQLLRRRLYTLAEQYCENRIRARTSPQGQAWWAYELARVYRRHTWLESAANRTALTRYSVERITDFLTDHQVSPEWELALRLSQIEAILNLADIELLLYQAADRSSAVPQQLTDLLSQGTTHVTAFQKQIGRLKSQLDDRQYRRLREQARYIAAALSAIRASITGDGVKSAVNDLRAIERAARNKATRRGALRRQAELLLSEKDAQGVDLVVKRFLQRFPDNEADLLSVEIRRSLATGHPEVALQMLSNSSDRDAESQEAVLWLQTLLEVRRIAGELKDAAAVSEADADFQMAVEQTAHWKDSVWSDLRNQLMTTHHVLSTVGTEAAGLILQVDELRSSGQMEKALQTLLRAQALLRPTTSTRSRAAISQAIGELRMAGKDWPHAVSELRTASEIYREADFQSEAAEAEILIAFCYGQQWKEEPANESLFQQYVQALEDHRQAWKQEPSWQQAMHWLIQIRRQQDLLQAAELALDMAANAADQQSGIAALSLCGQLLEKSGCDPGAAQRCREVRNAFQAACAQPPLVRLRTDSAARLQLLSLSLRSGIRTPWESWNALQMRLPEIWQRVTQPDDDDRRRFVELQLVMTVRISTDTQAHERATQVFLQHPFHDRIAAAERLRRFLDPQTRIQPGDATLARSIHQLLEAELHGTPDTGQLIRILQLDRTIGRVTPLKSTQEEVLKRLLDGSLTNQQVNSIAQILTEPGSVDSSESRAFWRQVQKISSEGSPMWLEAIYQQAGIHPDADQALRRLQTTSVLYPGWGSPERRRLVEELINSLKSQD